jgi:hypothetical protein
MPSIKNLSEKAIQKKIITDLKMNGYWVLKTQGGVAGTVIGAPDIIACDRYGQFIAIEVKKVGGKLSEEQVYQLKRLANNRALAFVTNDFEFGRKIDEPTHLSAETTVNFDNIKTYQFRKGVKEVLYHA